MNTKAIRIPSHGILPWRPSERAHVRCPDGIQIILNTITRNINRLLDAATACNESLLTSRA